MTVGNLGFVYEQLSRYTEAINYYEQTLEIAQTIGDQRTAGNAPQQSGRGE